MTKKTHCSSLGPLNLNVTIADNMMFFTPTVQVCRAIPFLSCSGSTRTRRFEVLLSSSRRSRASATGRSRTSRSERQLAGWLHAAFTPGTARTVRAHWPARRLDGRSHSSHRLHRGRCRTQRRSVRPAMSACTSTAAGGVASPCFSLPHSQAGGPPS